LVADALKSIAQPFDISVTERDADTPIRARAAPAEHQLVEFGVPDRLRKSSLFPRGQFDSLFSTAFLDPFDQEAFSGQLVATVELGGYKFEIPIITF
jgi:hypothetical protein